MRGSHAHDGRPRRRDPGFRRDAAGHVATPPELARRLARGLFVAPGAGPTDLAFLDPACGEGALLLAVLQEARAAGIGAPVALRGIELDPERAAHARARLAAAGDPGTTVEILVGDALDPALRWPPGRVVANPPWVSFSGRQAASLPPATLARYRAVWTAMEGWPSLHGAFLERIALHVAAGRAGAGLAGVPAARVLVPASVGELERYAATRSALTRHCAVAGTPEPVDETAFPGVVEPALLLTLEATPRPRASREAWVGRGAPPAAIVAALETFPRLAPVCFGDPGVHTGNSARELVEREDPGAWPGLREGRDLAPFRLAPPRLGLRTDLCRGPERRFRYGPLDRYRAVPILVRQTADRPIAALHTQPTYFRNTLLACTPPPELDPAFCVAVLNSPVVAAWHRARHADARQRAFPQVKVSHLRDLPFPIAARADEATLHDLVTEAVRGGRWRVALEHVSACYGAAGALLAEAGSPEAEPRTPGST